MKSNHRKWLQYKYAYTFYIFFVKDAVHDFLWGKKHAFLTYLKMDFFVVLKMKKYLGYLMWVNNYN